MYQAIRLPIILHNETNEGGGGQTKCYFSTNHCHICNYNCQFKGKNNYPRHNSKKYYT